MKLENVEILMIFFKIDDNNNRKKNKRILHGTAIKHVPQIIASLVSQACAQISKHI